MEKRKLWPIILAAVVAIALIVGVIRAMGDDATEAGTPDPSGTPPISTRPSTTPTEDDHGDLEEDDGHADEPSPTYTPTNTPPTDGTDHHEDETVPESEHATIHKRNTQFWKAFSIRDPKKRDKALAKVAVPYLAEKMSVPRTDRIPVIVPERAAITAGSFSSAYIVTQDRDSGDWWYINFIYDPTDETWGAQMYEPAPTDMIADALEVLES